MENTMVFLQELFGSINVAAIVAVFVLVWLWGELGLQGKWQLASSFLTGVVLGILDKYFNSALANGSDWFLATLYGIILGGLASGAYESIKKVISKAFVATFDAVPADCDDVDISLKMPLG